MAITVRLTVLTGPHRGHKICFCGPTECEAGRAPDCLLQLTGSDRDRLISRHHCRFLIDPPHMEITDLASSNGTYVNGKPAEQISAFDLPEPPKAGTQVNACDLITIGGTTLSVDIVDCPHATTGPDGQPSWEDGTVKSGCPLTC